MLIKKTNVRCINSITHDGKVILFATDSEGVIWYLVKQDGFEDNALNGESEVQGWENWQKLKLPAQEEGDSSVFRKEKADLTLEEDESIYLLQSRYDTAVNQTAVAPVQLVSGLGHLYVFRQSSQEADKVSPNTLLVDRFVLDGITNELVPKLEVRYKRSRQKHEPLQPNQPKKQEFLTDSLDFRDANGIPFFEPTTELSLINQLNQGWFSIVLLPTNTKDRFRWHFFIHNKEIQKIELISIRASSEGLFELKDETVLEPLPDTPEISRPRRIPGIIRRTLTLEDPEGNELTVANGFSATKYEVQVERETNAGLQLLRENVCVMLAVPTSDGNTAVLSFAVALDGTLSQIDERGHQTLLRDRSHDVLLPLNTLDEIKPIGTHPPLQGEISGMRQGRNELIEIISTEGRRLKTGDTINISGTTNYNGHFKVLEVRRDAFVIDTKFINQQIGVWELVPPENTGPLFDGMVTGITKQDNGTLEIRVPNHRLEKGDAIQLENMPQLSGHFPITKLDRNRFLIDQPWHPGEFIDLKMVSRRRRGILFDGMQDFISTPSLELTKPQTEIPFGYTFSAWVWLSDTDKNGHSQTQKSIVKQKDGILNLFIDLERAGFQLKTHDGFASIGEQTEPLEKEVWFHIAVTAVYSPESGNLRQSLFLDGLEIANQEIAVAAFGIDTWMPEFVVGHQFPGKISDLRIWDQAQTPEAIKNTMYLELTGREVGLVGYYRLGAIAAGKVVDFSVFALDGTVHGDPFVSAVTLQRTLQDDKSPVIRYTNEDLFAVTQRATYLETFEFKVDTAVNPYDIDGNNTPLFTFTYWGKRSRNSKESVHFGGEATQFDALENGWYRAGARFTVPDNVNLVRLFEIADVAGEWGTIEIRKHAMRQISDAITSATYTDTCQLPTLSDAYTHLDDDIEQLEQQEGEENDLLLEKRNLEAEIKFLKGSEEEKKRQIKELEAEIASIRQRMDREIAEFNANPLNHWCFISTEMPYTETYGSGRRVYLQFANNANRIQFNVGEPMQPIDSWAFFPNGDGTFKIKNKNHDLYLAISEDGLGAIHYQNANTPSSLSDWKVEKTSTRHEIVNVQSDKKLGWNGQPNFLALNGNKGDTLMLGPWGTIYGVMPGMGVVVSHTEWVLSPQGPVADHLTYEQTSDYPLYLQKTKQLEEFKAWLEIDLKALLQQKTERLAAVLARLGDLQASISKLNTMILNAFREVEQTPQLMHKLHTDDRSLGTTGALLGFAQPQSRIQALATSDGNVQLSYFDRKKRLRLTNFDATADHKNEVFEQWRPNGLHASLRLDRSDSIVTLETPEKENGRYLTLGENWTIEAWFSWPLPETTVFNSLICGKDFNNPIVVQKSTRNIDGRLQYTLGVFQGGFKASKYDMASLTNGWHHIAAVGKGQGEDATTTFFIDGRQVGQVKANPAIGNESIGIKLAAIGNSPNGGEQFGKLTEVRAWFVALTAAEIDVNSKVRLTGNEPGLAAYWPFSEAEGEVVRNYVGKDYHGTCMSSRWCACAAPLGQLSQPDLRREALVSAEYSTIGIDPSDSQKRIAILRRFFATAVVDGADGVDKGVELFPDQRIEELELKWIGNAQFEPTLLGYIEGAPPVPSENLTENGELDYNGATSVSLNSSEDITFSWSREQEIGLGATLKGFFGFQQDIKAGLILQKTVFKSKSGFIGNIGFAYNFLNSSVITASSQSEIQNQLELRGSPEPGVKFPNIGRRFVPKNVGYALVTSGLADIYITRLKRSKRMIGYQVRPNEDIPIDVNTITFLINPAYTMNGSLDGQTGSSATSDRFFRHVPEMRAQYGAMYPASYYRLQEAYDLKNQIDNADKLRESYFVNFNSRLVDEASLGKSIDDPAYAPPEINVRPPEESHENDENLTDSEKIDRILANLSEEEDDFTKETDARQRAMEEKIQDQEQRVRAAGAYDGWQQRMEDLQIRAGKRNIVNSYVWDGDGGWHVEKQQFANTVEHTVGASLNFNAGLGLELGILIFGFGSQLTAAATLDLTQTMTKTESRSRGISLDVDLSGVEHVGITDFNDNPLNPGEKVDRYRFMSFYLEGSSQNFQDFFSYVVDPEWLASNDEEARALRQVQIGKPNKAWRVLHRVTYVERPALLGFGQERTASANQVNILPSSFDLMQHIENLQEQNEKLENKVNQILIMLRNTLKE